MSRLIPVSRDELIRRLKKLGFEGPYFGSKHPHMERGTTVIMIPNPHHGEDIGVDLLQKILRRAGISREEWLST
ncbi:MAG: type II toxin-antitoxin system HicA family toxin [Methanotrichaceae archaeon]